MSRQENNLHSANSGNMQQIQAIASKFNGYNKTKCKQPWPPDGSWAGRNKKAVLLRWHAFRLPPES